MSMEDSNTTMGNSYSGVHGNNNNHDGGVVDDDMEDNNDNSYNGTALAVPAPEQSSSSSSLLQFPPPQKMVKSILKKPSTISDTAQPPKRNTATIIQRWWKSTGTNGTSSSSNNNINIASATNELPQKARKTQQEILTSVKQAPAVPVIPSTTAPTIVMNTSSRNDNPPLRSNQPTTVIKSSNIPSVPFIDCEMIDELLEEPPPSNENSTKEAPTQQQQRFKKVATKTILSKQHPPMNSMSSRSVPSKATARKQTSTTTIINNNNNNNANTLDPNYKRPPTEVTIPANSTQKSPFKRTVTTKSPPPKKKASTKAKARTNTKVTSRASTTPKSTPTRKTTPTSRGTKDPIWEGVPEEKTTFAIDWNAGWIKRIYERQAGATKGQTDGYWYTPQKQYKLRSLVEVQKFVALCNANNNDEVIAFQKFKGR